MHVTVSAQTWNMLDFHPLKGFDLILSNCAIEGEFEYYVAAHLECSQIMKT